MKSEKMFIPDVDKIIALIEEIRALNQRKDAFFRSLQQASTNNLLLKNFLQILLPFYINLNDQIF